MFHSTTTGSYPAKFIVAVGRAVMIRVESTVASPKSNGLEEQSDAGEGVRYLSRPMGKVGLLPEHL
jgi:hypothetical protein